MTAIPNPLVGFPNNATAAEATLADPAPAVDPSHVVDRLNGLLRGEIAAAETYRTVLDKAPSSHVEPLTQIHDEHGRSCQLLRDRIAALGGTPADGSGLWGAWAQTVQSALTLIGGEVGSLRALREGEEHGQRDYETALNDVDDVTAQLIQNRLLPTQQQHLATLDRMLTETA
jgi:hypothetical protein